MKVIGENEVKIQLKESTGPMGPAGPQGPKGDKGDRGETGPRGLTGATGPKGDKGDKGERGEKGATGATGPQGEKGEKGETGATGAQGPQGEKGETGETGPQGPRGEKGEAGPQGEQGPQGEKGEKGDTGATGPQGPAGSIDNLPIASATQLGGVMPVAATEEMTQEVGVDEAGRLWATTGGSGGSSGEWKLVKTVTLEEDVLSIKIDEIGGVDEALIVMNMRYQNADDTWKGDSNPSAIIKVNGSVSYVGASISHALANPRKSLCHIYRTGPYYLTHVIDPGNTAGGGFGGYCTSVSALNGVKSFEIYNIGNGMYIKSGAVFEVYGK